MLNILYTQIKSVIFLTNMQVSGNFRLNLNLHLHGWIATYPFMLQIICYSSAVALNICMLIVFCHFFLKGLVCQYDTHTEWFTMSHYGIPAYIVQPNKLKRCRCMSVRPEILRWRVRSRDGQGFSDLELVAQKFCLPPASYLRPSSDQCLWLAHWLILTSRF